MHGNRLWRLARFLQLSLIQRDEAGKPLRTAADDRQRQRQPVTRSADHGFWRAADADPGAQRWSFDRRIHALLPEAGARAATPGDRLLFQQCDEEIDLLRKQFVVLRQVIAEERKRFCEGAATENDFSAAVR